MRSAGRLVAELGVIVLGVLLALAADAAWTERQDRSRETDYIRALSIEMRSVRDEFDSDQLARGRRLAIVDSLLSHFDERVAPDSTLARWILSARSIAVFFPPSAVFDDLVASGNLGLLKSDDLRYALMQYGQEVPRLRFLEEREQNFVESELRPYLLENFDLEVRRGADLVTDLLADRKFRSLMVDRRRRLTVTLDNATRLQSSINNLIGFLDRELGQGVAS